nr:hypothetical protein [Tanacetum cinerariifolium]
MPRKTGQWLGSALCSSGKMKAVMDAPTLPVSTKENLRDPIEIIVDIVYPAPADVFPAATVEILKKKLTNKYCPKGETKKLEIELWNLKVKGNDVRGYTQRFQELALMCTKFISNETEKVDKSDCPVLKNQGTEARGRVYTLGGGETNQDLDNAEDDINS